MKGSTVSPERVGCAVCPEGGLAGRHGRTAVMVTNGVRLAVAAQFRWGEGERVEIRGRRGMETVFPVIARATSGTASPGGSDDFARRAVANPEGNCDPSS